jgi:hypothetical protein
MQLEGSILCLQEPVTGRHPQPDESSPYHLQYLEDPF